MTDNGLQLVIEKDQIDLFREVLKAANRDYVLVSTEVNHYKDGSLLFKIKCPMSNAPMAFWHLGILDAQMRLSKRIKP